MTLTVYASRGTVLCGLIGLSLMTLSLFGHNWLYCQEKTVINNNVVMNVGFVIGLWKVCPINSLDNSTDNYIFSNKELECVTVIYNYWSLEDFQHLDIWTSLQFTPQFVARMRVCPPFGCIGLLLLLAATISSVLGHCRRDNSMLLACGLHILAGILIGSGLLVFASILSDSYYEGMTGENIAGIRYYYGSAFFYAAGALAMAMLAVVFSATSYMYKFGSVEDMVRAMVPGADRRLRQHISSERLLRGPEVVPPPVPYRDTEPKIPDLCEAEHQTSPTEIPIPSRAQNQSRFKTLSGREPRYAAPPRPPAQFYSLPRKTAEQQKQATFCTKSAV